jgi:hypothetical protein
MNHHKSLSSFEDEPNQKNNEPSYRMSSGRGKDFPKLSSEKEEEEEGGDEHFKVLKSSILTLDIFCL